ncbi:hypothetical protein EJ05DRAFT_481001 [Pseudovirgaria hyperparasitica]|uniref:PX domain-containing protein n=1 Tax=Pseudovirgaria hyperparasitica TaxID=470096 RepID=A0A6A6VT44_9PEZI|nr:uncharacterized protein EJ05DRAFT_481001 [Pseudovirgaria hyperparasitica]KAF2752760.1 hypothetical protein EJ05DRAFT_481001 [Pseudovirgaria hyperparasitica]
MSTTDLTPAQAHALFDILTHHETYAEIENFKSPDAIHQYGKPFIKASNVPAKSPLLQILFTRFATNLPGLRNVAPKFWQEQCSTLLEKLGGAELSESYERGTLGARKTVATAISAVLEYPARGVIGGFARKNLRDADHQYDISKAEDVLAGWEDFTQRLVYADMVDEVFARCALTDKLEDHSSIVQAAHEFMLVNFASFVHHILISSPDGLYLLKIMENAHRLIPYTLIRQTLKVGNAASMINAMVRVVLAKLSVTSVTNWIGLSNNPDDGMNLVQQIISQVLKWDINDFQKQMLNIEKTKDGLTKDQIDALRVYLRMERRDHERLQDRSLTEAKSIAMVIFDEANLPQVPTELQHSLALEYLQKLLEVRDREELIAILCRHSPDILTQPIRDAVAAYDPVIRALHNAVDLSSGLWDLECFLNDLIKLSKSKTNGEHSDRPPSVQDYVDLCKKHQSALHRFLYQIAKNGTEITEWFREWSHNAVKQFREPELKLATDETPRSNQDASSAGAITGILQQFTAQLTEEEQNTVRTITDAHAEYLGNLHRLSHDRMTALIDRSDEPQSGPGMYLAKWQSLLDNTLITPVQPNGPVRRGKDKDVRNSSKRGPEGADKKAEKQKIRESIKVRDDFPEAPNAEAVTKLLGQKFREYLAQGIS